MDAGQEKPLIRVPLYPEHAAALPLIALVPNDRVEVGVDVRADNASSFFVKRERFASTGFVTDPDDASKALLPLTATGSNVRLITGGLFDLRAIVDGVPR